jgi:hypothetical protein
MVRSVQFVAIFRLAILLGSLVATVFSALAADTSPDPQQPLSELRARAEASQVATATEKRGDDIISPLSTRAQLRPPPGAPPPPTVGLCHLAAGGQCCARLSGGRLCFPTPASGTCPRGSICCSEVQRASGACSPPAVRGGPLPPIGGTCKLADGGSCCSQFSGTTLCTPVPASGTCPDRTICCSQAERKAGTCDPPPPPSEATAICPPLFRTVDGTCCSQSDVPYICFARSSGACLPTDGAYNDGIVSACCRENTGGVCVPPPASQTSTQPTEAENANLCELWLLVPGVGFTLTLICEGRLAGQCLRDSDCVSGMFCRAEDRQCVDPGQPR